MPPLSAYTPFESLLFFQSLATLHAPPTSFAAISETLRNNPFVCQNAAFDASRLSPQALEELYTTLMRDGIGSDGTKPTSTGETNGTINPKKRKISSPRVESLSDDGSHATTVPELVSHLYARYKDAVTREIRTEEKRYQEIRNEIARLEKEQQEAPRPAPVVQETAVHLTGPQGGQTVTAKAEETVPEPMDVDVKAPKPMSPLVKPTEPTVPASPARPQTQPTSEPPKAVHPPSLPPAPVVPPATPSAPRPGLSAPPAGRIPATPVAIPPQARPPGPPGPRVAGQELPPFSLNGPPSEPTKQPATAGPPIPGSRPPTISSPAQPARGAPPPSLSTAATSAGKPQPVQLPQVQTARTGHTAPARPAVTTTKPAGRKSQTASTPAKTPQPIPGQHMFHQWSANQPIQSLVPRPSPAPTGPSVKPAVAGTPLTPQQLPRPEFDRAYQSIAKPTAPATPGPVAPPLPSTDAGAEDFRTPDIPVQALSLPATQIRPPRPSIDISGSLTPWKRSPRLDIPDTPGSPVRPRPEDVSPISERAPSPIEIPEVPREPVVGRRRGRPPGSKGTKATREAGTPDAAREAISPAAGVKAEKHGPPATRKRRAESPPSSRSRGRSTTSRGEDSPVVTGRKAPGGIKTEAPDEVEADTKAIGTRRRGTAVTAVEEPATRGRPKRKRAASDSAEREHQATAAMDAEADVDREAEAEVEPIPQRPEIAKPFVLCTRNFSRTGAPIMNDVTMHKHASIFAKPLTERDAPGYRDLIYRPQDLKSIKSAIHQGSKAVAAATEAANTPVATAATDGDSPAPSVNANIAPVPPPPPPPPSKHNMLVLPKTEDVVPPKAIVNSAQLEKELIRMFANAIMFNPIPARGFGPAFPMVSESGSREGTVIPDADEGGGIIKATLEMFDDVEKAVTRWRAAERTGDDLNKTVVSLRRGSVSDINTDSMDESKG